MGKQGTTDVLRRWMDLDWLLSHEGVRLTAFAKQWKVSWRTVRRDLDAFEELGYPTAYRQWTEDPNSTVWNYVRHQDPIFAICSNLREDAIGGATATQDERSTARPKEATLRAPEPTDRKVDTAHGMTPKGMSSTEKIVYWSDGRPMLYVKDEQGKWRSKAVMVVEASIGRSVRGGERNLIEFADGDSLNCNADNVIFRPSKKLQVCRICGLSRVVEYSRKKGDDYCKRCYDVLMKDLPDTD